MVPSGFQSPGMDANSRRVLLVQDDQMFIGMAEPLPRRIFPTSDIEHPMEAAFDPSMASERRRKHSGR